MKLSTKKLSMLVPTCGLIALVLGLGALGVRFWLYKAAIDEKDLVTPGHPSVIVSYVLTVLVPGILVLLLRPLPKKLQYPSRGNVLNLAGAVVGAAGIFYTTVTEMLAKGDRQANYLSLLAMGLGIAAGVAMLLAEAVRFVKGRPLYYCHALVTVYFILHILSQYRTWNIESQLQYYLPQLLASAALMLAAYYRASLENGSTNVRTFLMFNYSAAFLCCMAIKGDAPVFYLSMMLWTVTAGCKLTPLEETPNEYSEADEPHEAA